MRDAKHAKHKTRRTDHIIQIDAHFPINVALMGRRTKIAPNNSSYNNNNENTEWEIHM